MQKNKYNSQRANEQIQELQRAVDWLCNQSAHLFLVGEIIEIHKACEFLAFDKNEADDIIFNYWMHITQNILPIIEDRKRRDSSFREEGKSQ